MRKQVLGYRLWLMGALIVLPLLGGALASQAVGDRPTIDRSPISPVAQTSEEPTMESAPAIDPRLTTANTRFGLKLFSQLQADAAETALENSVISPASVAMAMAMAYNGASGETQTAMANALELQDLTLDELNHAHLALLTALETADPEVQLTIANSLWSRQNVDFLPDFLQRNQTFYQAETATLDFNSPEALTRINGWVSDNTAGKIPSIVDQLEPELVLLLINAVYFQGNWTTPFAPDATTDRPFFLQDGSEIQHPTMVQQGRYRYAETDQFQAVSLPYGDGQFSLYIFLPKPDSSLAAFQSTLTPENWDKWLTQFNWQLGAIELPRFTLASDYTLNDALQALGMEVAFSSAADFSNLSNTPTAISEVKHKAVIEVNETGTEAAASTSVGIAVTSAPVEPPFQLQVNRPFFFAIRDNQTGTDLFLGTVVDPQ
jgi:serine protease inhibitor